jgi:hypothetical protein
VPGSIEAENSMFVSKTTVYETLPEEVCAKERIEDEERGVYLLVEHPMKELIR